jgi:hypothetical protein
MTRRRWIKLWTQETLCGTTKEELAVSERWVWIGFLCLAGDSPIPGTICAYPNVPFTDDQLAQALAVPKPLLLSAEQKMVAADKIILNSGLIRIKNWEHYQDDYARVQKHRARKYETQSETPQEETPQTDQTRPDQIIQEQRDRLPPYSPPKGGRRRKGRDPNEPLSGRYREQVKH